MRTMLTSLALATASLVAGTADAAGFGGILVIPAVARSVAGVGQNTPMADLLACPISVLMCDGTYETPWRVSVGANAIEATGSCYRIRITLLTADATRFEVTHTNVNNNGIKEIDFGSVTTQMCFDRTNPNPGTAGSLNGRDVWYGGGSGAWLMSAHYSVPVRIGPAIPRNDVYNKLKVKFSVCFDAGDSVVFYADTDALR
jgi:hypothetical protein